MKRKSTCTFALGFTSFSLWAAVPTLTVSYNDVANADFSAKLTWEGAASVERRIGTYGAWELLAADQNGSHNDTSAKAGVRYCYRLVDAGEAGVAQEFRPLRKLPTTEQMVVSWGDFSSQGWCKPPANAFNGDTGRDSYPDANTLYPQVGIDFGSADHHVGYVRLYPRETDNCQGRLNGTAIYGFSGSWDGANENSGTKLSESLSGVSDVTWYALAVEGLTAYPIYYIQGAYAGNVNECEFYGWTDEDAAQEGPDEPPSGPVEPADAELMLKSVSGAVAENFEPTLSWTAVNCPLTVQRKIGEGLWETIGTVVANGRSFTDTTAPVGYVCTYRLQAGVGESAVANYSNEMTNRRIRRLTIPNDTNHIFWGGKVDNDWYKDATYAFDGDVNTWPDLGGTPKICVDFGGPTHFIGFVRVASRANIGFDEDQRLNGFVLYGSNSDGQTEVSSSADGEPLTESLSGVSGKGWYELTSNSKTAYRTYYFQIANGNATEVELYGWTLADVGEVYFLPLTVEGNVPQASDVGTVDFRAKLSWSTEGFVSGKSVALERAFEGSSVWKTLVADVSQSTTFLDEDAPVGRVVRYRLACEGKYGEEVTYRRLRRLMIPADETHIFWGGVAEGQSWYTKATKAFDGDVGSWADLNDTPKVCADFGSADQFVAKVCVASRNDRWAPRLKGFKLFGSQKDGATERDSSGSGVVLTDVIQNVPENRTTWYTLDADASTAYRTYYFSVANGNVAEVEFYGWTEDDVKAAEPKGLILIFNGTKEN